MTPPSLAIIIPTLNEELCINSTTNRLLEILDKLIEEKVVSEKSFLFYIDDGSTDNGWSLIEKYNEETSGRVKGIKFSRNFGNQKAIIAGLLEAKKYNADCYISIDADLQQDETKISEFIEKYKNGAQIVLGIRNNRKTDNFFKKSTALAFYKLMNLLGVHIRPNHSDYRLISREVIEVLATFKETNIFLRGIFSELGFKKDYVYFDVKERKYGTTKFSAFSLYSLAMSGITSFSIIPLRIVTIIGLIMSLSSFLLGLCTIYDKIIGKELIPGWATIVVAIGFTSGIQILCLGIMAEYLGQLFQEVKARPRYIIEKELS